MRLRILRPLQTLPYESCRRRRILNLIGEGVVHAESLAKVRRDAPLDKVCLLGCGISTGWGAVWNTAKVERGATAAVFGIGAVGLSVIEGLVKAGASKIIAVDLLEEKCKLAMTWGATHQ